MISPVSPLARLLERLTPLEPEDRVDAIVEELIATGGSSLGLAEIDGAPAQIILHGVHAAGPNLTTTCARWIAAAIEVAPEFEARARLALTG